MYKWQIVWCILSVDYNQHNYSRLPMVGSPILHSVQKKSRPNSCVILFVWLHSSTAVERPYLRKGAAEWGTIVDASLPLAAALLHTACAVLRLVTTVRKYCRIWRTAQRCTQLKLSEGNNGFWDRKCGVDKQIPRNQWSFHFRYPAKRAISFLQNVCASLLYYTSSYPKFHISVSNYTDFYVFTKKGEM